MSSFIIEHIDGTGAQELDGRFLRRRSPVLEEDPWRRSQPLRHVGRFIVELMIAIARLPHGGPDESQQRSNHGEDQQAGDEEIIVKKGTDREAYKVTAKPRRETASAWARLTAWRMVRSCVPEGDAERAMAFSRSHSCVPRPPAHRPGYVCGLPLFQQQHMPVAIQAYKALLAERPDLRGRVSLTFLDQTVFDGVRSEDLTRAEHFAARR